MPTRLRNGGSSGADASLQTGVKFRQSLRENLAGPWPEPVLIVARFHSATLGAISQAATMSFPWPVTDEELTLDEALDIALRYFDLPQDEEQSGFVSGHVRTARRLLPEARTGRRAVEKNCQCFNSAMPVADRHVSLEAERDIKSEC
jgi:hypothetical protein